MPKHFFSVCIMQQCYLQISVSSALLVWHRQIFWCMYQVTASDEIPSTRLQPSCSCASGPQLPYQIVSLCDVLLLCTICSVLDNPQSSVAAHSACNHMNAPFHWFTCWHLGDYSSFHVFIQLSIHLSFPMPHNWCRCVEGVGLGIWQ